MISLTEIVALRPKATVVFFSTFLLALFFTGSTPSFLSQKAGGKQALEFHGQRRQDEPKLKNKGDIQRGICFSDLRPKTTTRRLPKKAAARREPPLPQKWRDNSCCYPYLFWDSCKEAFTAEAQSSEYPFIQRPCTLRRIHSGCRGTPPTIKVNRVGQA